MVMPSSVIGPDRPHSTPMKLKIVTTFDSRSMPSDRVLDTKSRTSSDTRWSGLSVPSLTPVPVVRRPIR